jgi:hypothetical protein
MIRIKKVSFAYGLLSLLCVVIGVGGWDSVAAGGTPAVSIIDTGKVVYNTVTRDMTLGFEFSTDVPVTVTHLGKYVNWGKSASASWASKIWDANGTEVATVAILTGTPTEMVAGHTVIFERLVPAVVLQPGNYIVAVLTQTPDEGWVDDRLAIIESGSHITWGRGRYLAGSFGYPTSKDTVDRPAYFGANFKYAVPASSPDPADGATGVPLDKTLQWEPGEDPNITRHYVYMNDGVAGHPLTLVATVMEPNHEYTPAGGLVQDGVYSWRVNESVDDSEPNDSNYTILGPVWQFTAIGTVPVIAAGTPADLCVWPDSNAVFTVAATNPFTGDASGLQYQWRLGDANLAEGAKYVDTNTPSLTVQDVNASDEGGYYCRVTVISNGKTSNSRAALLAVRRLLGHWPLDGNAVDTSGNGNNGTLMGGPSFVAGKVDSNALSLNGSSQYMNVPVSIIPAISAAKGISISLWLNGGAAQPSDDAVFGAILGQTVVMQVQVPYSDGSVYWSAGNQQYGYDQISSAAEPNDYRLRWNHWVFTKDVVSGTMAIYHNGVLRHSEMGKTKALWGAASLNFGASVGGMYYDGLMDDIRIYNYALSATEVATLYAAVNGPFCVLYPLCEEYDSNHDGYVTVMDLDVFAENWLECGLFPTCIQTVP